MNTFEMTIRYSTPGSFNSSDAPSFWQRIDHALRGFWEECGSLIQLLLVCGLWRVVMFTAAQWIM